MLSVAYTPHPLVHPLLSFLASYHHPASHTVFPAYILLTMNRGYDPHGDSHTWNTERTKRWVEAQARQTSYEEPSPPPSPPPVPRASPPRTPSKEPSSNRTTASSDQSMLHRAVPTPLPTPLSPASPTSSGHLIHAPSTRSRGRGRGVMGSRLPMPFPQSPPGSGYPMILEVGPPRVEVPLQRSRSQSQGGHSKVS